MKMAITEIIHFPNIPVKVTLNEYIEISKVYSTPKSNLFINGILDKLVADLTKENKINKTGRGLMANEKRKPEDSKFKKYNKNYKKSTNKFKNYYDDDKGYKGRS
jgi:hypothetical protein